MKKGDESEKDKLVKKVHSQKKRLNSKSVENVCQTF